MVPFTFIPHSFKGKIGIFHTCAESPKLCTVFRGSQEFNLHRPEKTNAAEDDEPRGAEANTAKEASVSVGAG